MLHYSTLFLDEAHCSLGGTYRRNGKFLKPSTGMDSTLKIEAVFSYETIVPAYQTVRNCIL
jgi:hypothetical protein